MCCVQVVEAYKKKAIMREGMRSIGRHTLFVTGIAALYFGVELGVGLARDAPGDWLNTAAAGAVAGGYLGARGGRQTPRLQPSRTFLKWEIWFHDSM